MTALLIILPIGAVLAGLVWLRLRLESKPPQKADTQDHLIEQNTSEFGHSTITRVTKDPVQYARIFARKR